MFKLSYFSVFCLLGCMAVVSDSAAATGRDGAPGGRANAYGAMTARMPSMPTKPIIGVVGDLNGGTNTPVNPDVPGEPEKPDEPDVPVEPELPDNPPSAPECPDGGVKNSEYTVAMCMNDILSCVNMGGVNGGFSALFNQDLRNSILDGLRVCVPQIDKCVSDVRRDCQNIYSSERDVWIDFYSRKVQPEYYNLVLFKTGLTPNQAEYTCMMLNNELDASGFEYGPDVPVETPELPRAKNLTIISKPNVDVQSAKKSDINYARWDATTATCYVRVGAYNKDKLITNTWLFGAAGNDKPAEAWLPAGDVFTCNKDLFGFDLKKDTATVAVVGIGGGAVLGTGIGAIAGHGKRDFDCADDSMLEKLTQQLHASQKVDVLNEYLSISKRVSMLDDVEQDSCREIVKLKSLYDAYQTRIDACDGKDLTVIDKFVEVGLTCPEKQTLEQCINAIEDTNAKAVFKHCLNQSPAITTLEACVEHVKKLIKDGTIAVDTWKPLIEGQCTFKPLNRAKATGTSFECDNKEGTCNKLSEAKAELAELKELFDALPILDGEKSNMGKSIAIGAAAGVGAGGLATAITAFVEKSNISCRIGNNLASVNMGKAHTIDTLKEFYVKWGLNLPQDVMVAKPVEDCQAWKDACAAYTDLSLCELVQMNYKPIDASPVSLIRSACAVENGVCVASMPVAKSYGACK